MSTFEYFRIAKYVHPSESRWRSPLAKGSLERGIDYITNTWEKNTNKRLLKTPHFLIETADNEGFCWYDKSLFIQTPHQDVVLFFRPTNCVKSHDKRPPRRSLGFGNLPKITPYFLNSFPRISYCQWVCTPLSLATTDEFTANDNFFLSQRNPPQAQQQQQHQEEEEATGVTQFVKKKHDSIM